MIPFIHSITLTHFRNYTHAHLEPQSHLVALVGKNGAGKTNLLEAISCLTSTRGLRRAKAEDFAQQHPQNPLAPWGVHTHITGYQGRCSLATGNDPQRPEKRLYRLENEPASLATMRKQLVSLSLTPQMDTVFSDGTTARRRLLDDLATLFFEEYSKQLSIYDHAKLERKKLLSMHQYDTLWCDQLEQRMAEQMVAIAAARLELCDTLNRTIPLLVQEAFPAAHLHMDGLAETLLRQQSITQAEQVCKDRLEASRSEDARLRRTHIGTHRSDFCVSYQAKHIKAQYASTGEQKALLLTLLLAAAMARKAKCGHAPLLLLDEVVSHLDDARRNSLLTLCETLHTQCWFTGTDLSIFSPHTAIECLQVDEGAIHAP